MKAGIVYSDSLTTVSETYANEIKYDYFGEQLDGIIRAHSYKLTGIVNGIDYKVFNPKTDKNLVKNYDKDSLRISWRINWPSRGCTSYQSGKMSQL